MVNAISTENIDKKVQELRHMDKQEQELDQERTEQEIERDEKEAKDNDTELAEDHM